MNSNTKLKRVSRDKILLGAGIVLLITFMGVIIYSFVFLAENVFPAISSGNGDPIEEVHFELNKFEELGI